jgi:hypothetical protein
MTIPISTNETILHNDVLFTEIIFRRAISASALSSIICLELLLVVEERNQGFVRVNNSFREARTSTCVDNGDGVICVNVHFAWKRWNSKFNYFYFN